MGNEGKIAVVTGGNRGIGYEICRPLACLGVNVILTARDEEKGRKAAEALQEDGLRVRFRPLDVDDPESIRSLREFVERSKVNYGRIVNVSSAMGSLTEMAGGYPAYRISKAALNAVTRVLAYESMGTNIRVNSMCPGWVRTEMGGAEAERSPAEGADIAVWLATLDDRGPTGGFFRDRKPVSR